MTIRLEHLTIEHDPHAWAMDAVINDGGTDATNDETMRFDVLSMVRHIMRERSDCNMIPVIRAVVLFRERNRYGHDGEIEVTYSTKGYRAIYGFRLGHRVTNVDCYMD